MFYSRTLKCFPFICWPGHQQIHSHSLHNDPIMSLLNLPTLSIFISIPMFRKRTLTCTDMDVDGKHNLTYYSSPGTIKILSPPFPWYSPKGFLWPWQQNCQFQFSAFRIPSSLCGTMAFDFLFLEVSVRQAYVLVHFYRGKRGNPSWLFRRAFNEFQIQIEVFTFPWQNSMLLGGRYRRKLPGPPVFFVVVCSVSQKSSFMFENFNSKIKFTRKDNTLKTKEPGESR